MPHEPRFNHSIKHKPIIKTIKREKEHKKQDLIGFLHGFGLHPLVEVGSEPEPPLRVLDDAADLPPSLERLLRRVLGLDVTKILIQIALHFFPLTNKQKCCFFLLSFFLSTPLALDPEKLGGQASRELPLKLQMGGLRRDW